VVSYATLKRRLQAYADDQCQYKLVDPGQAGVAYREHGEHGPVCPLQSRCGVGAAQHGDFVAQDEELDVLGGGRPTQQQE